MKKALMLACAGAMALASGLALAQATPAQPAAPATSTAAPAAAPPAAPATAPAAPAAAPAAAPSAAAPSADAALRTALAGNSVIYTQGRDLSTEYYSADGRYAAMSPDGLSGGTWTITGGKLCIAEPGQTTCWRAVISGTTVSWYDESGSLDSTGSIVPGNPTGL